MTGYQPSKGLRGAVVKGDKGQILLNLSLTSGEVACATKGNEIMTVIHYSWR